MPSAAARETLVRLTLALPASAIDAYQAAATKSNRTLEETLAARLAACASHDSARPLYLTDAEREEVEQILGGGIFRTASDLVRALRTAYTVRIGGAEVRVDQRVYTLLKDRAEETGTTPRALILELCQNALSDYALGGH